MSAFFTDNRNSVSSAMDIDEKAAFSQIEKALTTGGYTTDSATFINGRAMIPEDCESTMVNVVAQSKEDCKVLNSLKKRPVKSTVHEFNRRTDHGNYRHLSVAEGAGSPETDQSLERATVNMKFLQTKRSVTKQMETVDGFENALASEKIAGIETLTKGLEYMMFHGNSDVVPTEFDGFAAGLKKAGTSSINDFRGTSIGTKGEDVFDTIAREVWDKNGDLEKVMFPSILAQDVKNLFKDRLRFTPVTQNGNFTQMPDYTTGIGSTLRFAGDNAGADKFFKVKGKVIAEGSTTLRPAKPASVTAVAASNSDSQFGNNDAGDYMYTVHAVNAYGVSEGTSVSAAVTVAAGDAVTLTITNGDGVTPTGYIICRSAKGGTEVMEMDSCAAASKKYVDVNAELPGTASMIFLPKTKIQNAYEFAQLLPVSTYPLYPTASAETPFLIMCYGALALKAPEHMAMAKNIAYTGGLY